jgi:hypothetical protein
MLDSEKLKIYLDPTAKQANLANLAIPVIIGGTLASPSVAPDPAALAKGAAGAVTGMVPGAGSEVGAGAVGAVTGLVTGKSDSSAAPVSSGGCGAAAATPAAGTAEPHPPVPEQPAKAVKEKTKEKAKDALKELLP